jgi:phosphoribosylformylglycinamidine cyclo-ligase
VIKDNLFDPPEIFKIIQQSSGADDKEMYQVFNMGCRLEIYTDAKNASTIVSTAHDFGIDAQIVGRVDANKGKLLSIQTKPGSISYEF